ncbi:MAG: peptidoglycan-binding protein [Clostridia bacterium]|nr:peptidoglycan-binding protein [Clostridia bacterium]
MSLTPTPLPDIPANVMAVTRDPSAPTPEPVLRTGSRGQEVKDLQSRLYQLGYYTDEIDGQFGGATKSAVIDFQKANGLEADGMVGSETKAVLFSVQAKPKADP